MKAQKIDNDTAVDIRGLNFDIRQYFSLLRCSIFNKENHKDLYLIQKINYRSHIRKIRKSLSESMQSRISERAKEKYLKRKGRQE